MEIKRKKERAHGRQWENELCGGDRHTATRSHRQLTCKCLRCRLACAGGFGAVVERVVKVRQGAHMLKRGSRRQPLLLLLHKANDPRPQVNGGHAIVLKAHTLYAMHTTLLKHTLHAADTKGHK